jgi:hypothetical protein
MKTQPKLESEARQSNQNHHGPFYHSAELVAAVHRAEGGIFETFRAAHVALLVTQLTELQSRLTIKVAAEEPQHYGDQSYLNPTRG